MLKRILMLIMVLVFIVSLASLAHASGVEAVLKMMLKKGMITQADYDEVMVEIKGSDSLERRVQNVEQRTADLTRQLITKQTGE